ncbi:MAG: GntR family transcriptional regulator, partial [Clostridiales bacterium]|jgi:DNA-binding FadR family transcriptional regulator|nr:GntR family transcriptional regulator [Clostridiales bacterium]
MQGRGSFVKNSKGSLLLSNSLKYIDMTEDEYREIMEFRQAIEFRSFDLIQKYGTKEDYDLIESALKTMDHYAKKENYEPIKFNTADFEFHYSIIKGSKNNLFISIMNDYKDIILYCFNSTIDNIDIIIDRNVIADHYEIFNAIKSGNGNLAKEIMIKNNEKNRLYSKNYFKKKS